MKKDIILAGVGGQGILSIAAIIGYAAIESGLYLKQAEVHGMSQRGGDVQSHLRLSSSPVASDLIPKGMADMIISVEPMESLRYLPYLSQTGWLVTNNKPFVNISNYPDLEELLEYIRNVPNSIALDAELLATEAGSVKAANVVILGAASPFLDISYESLIKAIHAIFERKGDEIVKINIAALKAGRDIAEISINQ
jgi:indolepyruvate ferredoxin oxidoreductase, beta subunit